MKVAVAATLLLHPIEYTLAAPGRNGVVYKKSVTGISYYDYQTKENRMASESSSANSDTYDTAKLNSKVAIDVKGYLAGRNGWQFIDTTSYEDGEIRLTLGKTPAIKGLEIGLIGADDVSAMHKGDRRRIVIPSRLGFISNDQQPIPIDDDNKRRLYSTVFNKERGNREREALGDSIVGELILDVQLKRVKN